MVTVRAPSSSATTPRKIAPYRPVRIPIDRNRSPKGAKASSPKPMLMGIVNTAAMTPPVRSPRRLLVQLPGKTANAEPPARGADCSARGSSDRLFASTTRFCPMALRNARDVNPDLVDAGARGDVQGLVVGVAELDIGDELGREYRPQMSALGRYDPHPARSRFPDVALDVDLQAVGDSGSRIAADVDEHLAVGHRVVGQDTIAPHVLVAAAVRVESFFVGRERQAVRVGDVVDDAAHASALDHVDTLEVQALARVLLAKAQAAVGVGEVDRAVLFDDDVVRSVELLAFEAVGEHGALAVLLDPVDRPSGPGRDDEPALPVEGEPVRADHVELLEQGIARVLPVGLLEAHAPDVGPGIAAAVHVDGRFAPGRELVDHVRGDVAQEQVAALLDPDEPFRKPEAALHQLQPGVGGHQRVERRVESRDGGPVRLGLRAGSAGSKSRDEQECRGNRRVFHETPDHIPRILPISAMYWPAFRPSATTVSSPFSMAWRKPCKPSLTQ